MFKKIEFLTKWLSPNGITAVCFENFNRMCSPANKILAPTTQNEVLKAHPIVTDTFDRATEFFSLHIPNRNITPFHKLQVMLSHHFLGQFFAMTIMTGIWMFGRLIFSLSHYIKSYQIKLNKSDTTVDGDDIKITYHCIVLARVVGCRATRASASTVLVSLADLHQQSLYDNGNNSSNGWYTH